MDLKKTRKEKERKRVLQREIERKKKSCHIASVGEIFMDLLKSRKGTLARKAAKPNNQSALRTDRV